LGLRIQENVSLAPFTTLKIGGKARFFARAHSEDEIVHAFELARELSVPTFILGGGSNILVSDNGFPGLVLQIALSGISQVEDDSHVFVTAKAGEEWDEFVEYCVGQDLAGVECLSGIPGFVGATPIQNVGAYGQDVSETIRSVRVLSRETGHIRTLDNSDCGFSYRTSIFNTTDKNKYVMLSVTFRLKKNGVGSLKYADLQKYFAGQKEEPTLADIRNAVIAIRAAKSMVIDEKDPNSRSAGSFFKNPEVSAEKFAEIEQIAAGQKVPHYQMPDDKLKIPAAWLIEKSGFHKGYTMGNAGISENHTLALINKGNAIAADILALVAVIKQKVAEHFGITLAPEPVFVGFDEHP
jgi:UDP-N-acetylmuramate dehydrogenase